MGYRNRKPLGVTFRLFRYPLLFGIGCILLSELVLYIIIRIIVVLYEYVRKKNTSLRTATSFEEWQELAHDIDEQAEKGKWRDYAEDPFYDSQLICTITHDLRRLREAGNVEELQRTVRDACRSNLGGIENERLYSHAVSGTKHAIGKFYAEVESSVAYLMQVGVENKPAYIRSLQKAYGKSCLYLSGGAAMGYYHLGVIKALLEAGCLPNIISGTSAGALVAAFICVRTDKELVAELDPNIYRRFQPNDQGILAAVFSFFQKGNMFDAEHWREKLRDHVTEGDMTFRDAYERTGRELNVSVAADVKSAPPLCLNHKTTPDVVIWSAVLASSAVPGLLEARPLISRNALGQLSEYSAAGERWRDGVLRQDLPLAVLRQQLGVAFSIVSMVEPHVAPFFYEHRGSAGGPSQHLDGHGWRGGFLGTFLEHFLKLEMKKWLRLLHHLHVLPRILGTDWTLVFLQKFEGNLTMVPSLSVWDYWVLIQDPTRDAMTHYLLEGQKICWPKIAMIRNRLRVEKAIFDCGVRAKLRANRDMHSH